MTATRRRRTTADLLAQEWEALLRPADWTASALCAQADPDAFFPEMGGSARAAKAVCSRCPVRAECLAEALANREPFGVWGGLTARERRGLGHGAPADVGIQEQGDAA